MSDAVDSETEELLTSEPLMAHLATCRDGRPHVAPLWYRYEDGVVELVTTGTKLRNVRENPKVALSVQKDEGGHAKWMVTLLGTATVVEDETETRAATRKINEKYGVDSDAWDENVLVRVDVGSASSQTYD
ncbi:Pyridoxamine 5'-phosphate oxidase [Halopelagius inordinatus]|uniref:Pyridoxamine 5'-phosphate oxidase n=1 Tax=Halopelagius inordinatus TaxID=553467 RepID=A0A1I2SUJ1_9EURY|nr:pyridoxamine 5'-phosphate oxidase family protein [Halopelagius inordinatus]SFG56380.1 Pyridoxamine 5'-phosphate oxidase [Halopelagius inordinatus]